MPHVALIALSGFRIREREMLDFGMSLPGLAARAGAVGALPALGLLTIAALTPPQWSVSYHEAAGITDALIEEIVRERPKVAAISALTASVNEAYALAARLRAEGILVVLGGLHATACPDEASLHVDAVVVGDGEPSWPRVLEDAESGALRKLYRAAAFDLAASPVPRFDLLGAKPRPRYTLQTERGCPFACEFCGASRLLGPFREKPVENIARELEAITALRPRATIELADDTTFAARRPVASLLDALERSGVRYFTEADWRLGERPEVLDRLAASGCVQVLVGIESLVHRYSGMGAKAALIPRVMDAIERVQDAGVAVIGCFVVGSDDDCEDSIRSLGDWILAAPLADVQITIQTPFPGTKLRRDLAAAGRLLPDRGWESCTLFDVTYTPARMSAAALQAEFCALVARAFGPEAWGRRAEIRRRIWGSRYGDCV